MANLSKFIKDRIQRMKIGGAVSLKSLWTITNPEKLNKIIGSTATLFSKECENGHFCLYIKLPLENNNHEELRVWNRSSLCEDDIIDISSIIVLFIDNGKGETILRYDALENKPCFQKDEDAKSFLLYSYANLMMYSSQPIPMNIKVTYEGGALPKSRDGVSVGDNGITILNCGDYNYNWRVVFLRGYKNAIPLFHGLILVEKECKEKSIYEKTNFDIIKTDGTLFCKRVESVDYGHEYITISAYNTTRYKIGYLWWINRENNCLEEIKHPSYNDEINYYSRQRNQYVSLEKMTIDNNDYFYIYNYSVDLDICHAYSESDFEWEPNYYHFIGLLNKDGKWSINPDENISKIVHCFSVIIAYRENNTTLYNSKVNVNSKIDEIITVDNCTIDNNYIYLHNQGKIGLFDPQLLSLIIPCCIDEKYHLMPTTIGEDLIGAFINEEEIVGGSAFTKKKYFYLDLNGNVKLEVEEDYKIVSGFHNGQSIISHTDYWHGEYYRHTIDKEGHTIEDFYDTFQGQQEIEEWYDRRNQERDNWDAMTDGMYGDYPDEGYDGDYESIGF